jgi:pyruvate kinase
MSALEKLKIVSEQKTKIISTIGPASSSYDKLLKLVQAGADVFRLNFSHGSHEDHQKVIDNVVAIRKTYQVPIALMADLQGPKLRVGKMQDGGIDIRKGDILTFTNKECIGTKDSIYMSYESFAADVNIGEKVLIDDGKIVLKVLETNGVNKVKMEVIFGSKLSSNKGVNLPDTNVSLPCLTKKDLKDLDYILTQPFNWIALSFVRRASDIRDLKKRIEKKNHLAKVIAKIEKPDAVLNIKSIIKATDAVMIARGDLGVEVPMERLPNIQKDIIKRCITRSTPVIVATQMMESMITNPSPTRSEVTDVANAVLDGTDAVMLSGETSVGNHPERVVEAMNRILLQAEKHYELLNKRPKPDPSSDSYYSDMLCINAAKLSDLIKAKAIVGLTVTGYTGFKMSSYRPKANIFIFSSNPEMLNTLNLVWGIRGFYYNEFTSTDETIEDLSEIMKDYGVIEPGDVIINTGSMPLHKRFKTNMMKITIVE